MLLYFATLVVSFMVLVTHLSPHLSLLELACGAIPVGSVAGAWLFFLLSALLSFLGYVVAEGCVWWGRSGATVGAVLARKGKSGVVA